MAAMKNIAAILFILITLGLASLAHAATQADAREIARINNCPPKKIDVYQQSLGPNGETIFRVDCLMPKSQGDTGPTADALLIKCDQTLCTLLRPLTSEKK